MSHKACTRCRETKPESEFYLNRPSLPCRKCHRAYVAQWAERNRAKKLEYNRKWRRLNPERRKSMNKCATIVFQAKRKGLLIAPDHCSRCKAAGLVEAAHTDYSKPMEVTWLCRPCHRAWDSKEPKTLAFAAAEPESECKFPWG